MRSAATSRLDSTNCRRALIECWTRLPGASRNRSKARLRPAKPRPADNRPGTGSLLQLARPRGLDRDSGHFEARAAHQLVDADEGARRKLPAKVRAVNGIELVVQIKIGAVHGYRHEIVHGHAGLFDGA